MNPDEVFDNKYFRLNRTLLKQVSLWPYESTSTKVIKRIFIMVGFYSMSLPQMIRGIEEIRSDDPDPEIIIENLSGFIYFHGVISKLITQMVTENKLKYLYEEISKDWKTITDKNEKAVLEKSAAVGHQLTIFYTGFVVLSAIFFVSITAFVPVLLNHVLPGNQTYQKQICIYAEYFVDQEKYFYYIFTHTMVIGVMTVYVATAIDSVFVNCVQHVLGLFNIIKYRLKEISRVYDSSVNNSIDLHFDVKRYLIDIILTHKKSLEFTNLIQSAYNECFFLLAGLIVAGLSAFTYVLSQNVNNPLNFMRIWFLWFGVIVYMFFVNLPGQKLLNISEELLLAIYDSSWHKFPIKTRFLIQVMMLRCLKPCRLTAGPLIEMNFASCSNILRTAFSYFTVVNSMNS
ncbi:odorant receptor 9a-like isoform X1 [Trichogramma pretiosum]|uniref:odorant receptor 9a-like isoform X1 n=1 Tax=Trichogramma pretiosum TaxID=7493 RepID=UPI0006C9BE00|nr:odorant receptor 9a-like isoform X1 [Trichogramma pretiosum]